MTTENSSAATIPRTSYRHDVDGLRGIAIALVVIFHIFVGRVSGGVDVFLLLSGYFFLGSQLRYAGRDNATLNPLWPIWRTIRRLAPALLVTLGATAALVKFLVPSLETSELYKQFTASVLYYQNWELSWQDQDYSAASSDTSPLQHLWSMSVQGQFYLAGIIFALILGAIWRGVRSRRKDKMDADPSLSLNLDGQRFMYRVAGPILIMVTIASFAYAARFGLYGTPLNYYSTFSRTWELTLGAVLAIYCTRVNVGRVLGFVLVLVGLAAIFATGFVVTETTAFPGPLTLLPLGGAALVIIGGASGNVLSRLMSRGVVRWLGTIAYSLYLWHWPLLIVATVYFDQPTPSVALGVGIVVASLILAHITNLLIEKPLAQKRARPVRGERALWVGTKDTFAHFKPKVRGLAMVCLLVLCGTLLALGPRYEAQVAADIAAAESGQSDPAESNPEMYPGARALLGAEVPEDVSPIPDPNLVGKINAITSVDHCFIHNALPADHFTELNKDGEPCVYGDKDSDFLVLIAGGSHAEQWADVVDILGKKHGFRMELIGRMGCPLVIGDYSRVSEDCATWSQLAVQRIVEMDPDLVITSSTRPGDAQGFEQDVVPEGYVGFWNQMAAYNIPVMGLRDNPWGTYQDKPENKSKCLASTGDVQRCSMDREAVYAEVPPTDVYESLFPNMTFVDTSDWFCPNGECPPVIGNIVVYRDHHHISVAYSRTLEEILWEHLAPLVGQEAPGTATLAPTSTAATSEESFASSTSAASNEVVTSATSDSAEPTTSEVVSDYGGYVLGWGGTAVEGGNTPLPRAGGLSVIAE